jgi:signal transduction histidine kinase
VRHDRPAGPGPVLTPAAAGGALALRPRPPLLVQDAVLAVLVASFQLLGTVHAAANQPAARPLAEPGNLGYLLLAAAGAVLVARRRWPDGVFATAAGLSLAYYAAGYPDGPGMLGLLVAVYSVAVQGGPGRRPRLLAPGIAVLGVGWLLAADLRPFGAAGWVLFRLAATVAAAALGASVRGRRLLAAEALERAERAERTREQEARRRVDAERLRIAREVHDTVAHAIAVINVQAGVTGHLLDRRPERVREALASIEQTSARALGELRATLGVLREADDGQGPAAGLDRLAELVGLARQAGLDVELAAASPPRELPPAVDRAAYRILQEAVTNVLRHAGPARVAVTVTSGDDALVLRVADDGRGPGPAGNGAGQGIVGMRERAALLGGELTAGPRPGGGFEVLARLPLEPGRRAAR